MRGAFAAVMLAVALATTPPAIAGAPPVSRSDHFRVDGDLGVPIPVDAPDRDGSYSAGLSLEVHAIYVFGILRAGLFGSVGGANWLPSLATSSDTSLVPWWSAGGSVGVRIVGNGYIDWIAALDIGVGRVHVRDPNCVSSVLPAGAFGTGFDVRVNDQLTMTMRGSLGTIGATESCSTAAIPAYDKPSHIGYARLALGASISL